jgi:hypothetical protein
MLSQPSFSSPLINEDLPAGPQLVFTLNNRFFRHQACYSLLTAKPGGQADRVVSLWKYKVVGVPYQLYILWCLCTLSAVTYIQWCLHIIPWCMCTLSAVRTMVSVFSINSNYHGFCVLKNQPAMVAFLLSAVRTTASVYSAVVIRVHVLYELYILVSFSCTYHGSV